jgi:PAS domain S-box-containing protein
MRNRIFSWPAGCGVLLLCASLWAQAPPRTVVRVAINTESPFVSIDKDHGVRGFPVDLINAIARRLDLEVTYVTANSQACGDQLARNEVDLIGNWEYTPARAARFNLGTEALLYDAARAYVLKGTSLHTLADLNKKRVGILRDDTIGPAVREFFRAQSLKVLCVEAATPDDVLKLVEKKVVDAGLLPGLVAAAALPSHPLVTSTALIFSPVEFCWAAAKGGSAVLLAQFDAELAALKADEKSLYHRRLAQFTSGHAAPDRSRRYAMIAAILTVALAASWIILHYRIYVRRRERASAELRRREAETALEQERNQFLSGPMVLFKWQVVNDVFTLTYVSPNVTQFGFLPRDFLSGKVPYLDIMHPDDKKRVLAEVRTHTAAGHTDYEQEYRLRSPDGQERWVHDYTLITCNPADGSRWYDDYIIDVTDRKKAELALHDSQEQFAKAFSANPALLALSTIDEGRYLDVNQTFLDALGFAREEVVGKTSQELGIVIDFERREEIVRQMRHSGPVHNAEMSVRTRSGALRHGSFSAEKIRLRGRDVLLTVMLDITDRKAAELALQDSEEKARSIIAQAGVGMALIDPAGTILTVNERFCAMTGFAPEELIGTSPPYRFWPRNEATPIAEKFQQFICHGQGEMELNFQRKDGIEFPVQLICGPVLNARGERTALVGIFYDISQRKAMESELATRERFLSNIFSSIQDGISVLDRNLGILQVNPVMEKLYAHALPLAGKKCYEAYHSRTERCEICPTRQALQTGAAAYAVVPRRGPGRSITGWLDLYRYPLKDQATGEITGVIEYVRDISARRQAEEALRESEERFRKIFEESSVGIFTASASFTFERVNPAFCRMMGYTAAELQTMTFRDITHPDNLAQNSAQVQTMIREKLPFLRAEKRYVKKDGSQAWGNLSLSLVRDESGRQYGLGIIEDITARKQAETALRESEEHFRQLAENSPNMIFINQGGKVVYANHRCEELLGYTCRELCGPAFNFMDLIAPENRDDIRGQFRQHQHGQEVSAYEYGLLAKDGRRLAAINSSKLITYQGRPAILGVVTDITEWKKAAAALMESQRIQATIFNISPAATILSRLKTGECVDANEAYARLTGYTREELFGRTTTELNIWLSPEERQKVVTALAAHGKLDNVEITLRRKDGELIHTVAGGEILTREGEQYILSFFFDITERKKAADRLQASLKEKDVLLQEVHHRVKNNLQVITSLLSLQSRYISNEHDLALFKESMYRVRSMALVHEQLYQSEDLASIDMGKYTRRLAPELFRLYGADPLKVRLTLEIETVALPIQQAIPCGLIMNELLTNAFKYAFPAGPHEQGEVRVVFTRETSAAGARCRLIVVDTGVGLPVGLDLRKPDSLGLTLVTMLGEEQLEGTVTLDRTGGTAFEITFPG